MTAVILIYPLKSESRLNYLSFCVCCSSVCVALPFPTAGFVSVKNGRLHHVQVHGESAC